MDKSGSRPQADNLIIDKPDLQTPRQRLMFGVVTIAAWMMWIYLWLPIITLLGWYFGVRRFHDVMITQSGAAHLAQSIGWYALVIVAICASLVGWALFNWARFRGQGRRNKAPDRIALKELLARTRFTNDVLILIRAQTMRSIIVHHDKKGVIVRIKSAMAEGDRASTVKTSSAAQPVETNKATVAT